MTDPQAIPLPIACAPATDAPPLSAMLRQHAPWTVLTGAGSRHVIDLHGRLDQVICMGCATVSPRAAFQQQLLDANPHWGHHDAATAPDGDADLSGVDFSAFHVPACPLCSGILKPDVVFYGEQVPAAREQHAMEKLAQSQALLVGGQLAHGAFRSALCARRQAVGDPGRRDQFRGDAGRCRAGLQAGRRLFTRLAAAQRNARQQRA